MDKSISHKDILFNAVVYVDFENIYATFQNSGQDPMELNFFKIIQDRLLTEGLTIIDFIVYGSFEKRPLNKYQTVLRKMGLQTRHSAGYGKNCSDMELTVDVLKDLYKNINIGVFVIITSDRDIIPLLKAIRAENKISFLFSTKNNFNPVVVKFATFHLYIEDICDLTKPDMTTVNNDLIETAAAANYSADPEKIERARKVATFFYNSNIWKKSRITGDLISLKGYIDVIMWVVKRSSQEILDDFKCAHDLGYVTMYENPAKGMCLREGRLMEQFKRDKDLKENIELSCS